MKFSVLASGSKGNAVYCEVAGSRFLIDCGISARQLTLRLLSIGVEPNSLDAVLVTHEHIDHIRGLKTLLNQHRVPVVVSSGTLEDRSPLDFISSRDLKVFGTGESFELCGAWVESFPVSHDARDPAMYRVSDGERAFAVVTDIGVMTDTVRDKLTGLSALVLESNHDFDLLDSCWYPERLKERVRSDYGHLSNLAAEETLTHLLAERDCKLEILVAGHISENSNRPELAVEGFERARRVSGYTGNIQILAGAPNKPTQLFDLIQGIDQTHGELACAVGAF